MKPILFPPNADNFSTNGLGRLSDAISCIVHEARNGEFELEMTYPITGAHFSEITHSSVIVAKPSPRRTQQPFRVYKITKPLNGRVTVLAQHLSYQLSFIPVSPFSEDNLTEALAAFKTNAAETCDFTLSADFTSTASYSIALPGSIRAYMGGQRGSLLDVYGGEWEFDGYNCILHQSRGQDNGYVIKYGKNLIDMKQEESIENTYTGIYPYWLSEEVMVTLPEKVVHSSNASNFPFQRTVVKDFSDKFTNTPTEVQLRNLTQSYITANGIGKPGVNLTVDFVNLADTEEYKHLTTANLDLCDKVTVFFEKLGVEVTSKVCDIRYDVLRERYDKIQIGDKRSTLATTIEDQLESMSILATTDDVARSVDRATGVLNKGKSGHVIIGRNAEGYASEILFLDAQSGGNMYAATNVLRINEAGIGFSSTGYNGNYYQAWTLDGHLSLGGVNGAYGDLQILDPAGKVLCELDENGLRFYDGATAQNLLVQVNHGGLYLYDTSGGTLAQLTNQGLNVYRGTIQGATIIAGGSADGSFIVQNASGQTIGTWDKNGIVISKGTIDIARGNEIGLYCDGTIFQFGDFEINDAYGRQILQSSDEMTGMSGQPDSQGGLYLWAGYTSDNDYQFVVNEAGAYVMYNGTPYNIGERLNYILNNCCGGGGCDDDCRNDCEEYACVAQDCDAGEICDGETCGGYSEPCPSDGYVCPEDDAPVCPTE